MPYATRSLWASFPAASLLVVAVGCTSEVQNGTTGDGGADTNPSTSATGGTGGDSSTGAAAPTGGSGGAADEPYVDPPASKVGVMTLEFNDAVRDRPLPTEVWYPTNDDQTEDDITYAQIFPSKAAKDAPIKTGSEKYPLIVMSHGSKVGRGNLEWLARDLASVGYIVAAPDHHGDDSFLSSSSEATFAMWRRPGDLTVVIDSLLQEPTFKDRIDTTHIGAAGHSSGGYAVISLAGGIFDPEAMLAECQKPGAPAQCAMFADLKLEDIDDIAEGTKSHKDARIIAGLALAPAGGPGFDATGLAPVSIPIHIAASKQDELATYDSNAKFFADTITGAELTSFETGGHFIFLPTCNTIGTFVAEMVCADDDGVDREQIHADTRVLARAFFGKHLH